MTTWTPRPNVPGNCRYFIVIGFMLFGVVDAWRNSYSLWLFFILRSGKIKNFCSLGGIFLLSSSLLPRTLQHFCHYCLRFAAGRIKHSLFREFPQIISYRVCLCSLCQSFECSAQSSRKSNSMCILLKQHKAQANWSCYWGSQCLQMVSSCLKIGHLSVI